MDIYRFCEGIQLHPIARQIVEQFPMDEKEFDDYKRLLYKDKHVFFDKVKEQKEYRQLFLYLYVRLAVDLYEAYRLKGIDDTIYFDTFSDFQIWCSNCFRDTGEYGLQQYNWLMEHIQLKLFRLGRLQFQPYVMACDLELPETRISKNQIVLNVHIPQGEPLDDRQVQESFEWALKFFRGISPVFICESWLLYPDLNKILKSDSNILKFQQQFYIYKTNDQSKQAEERIFNNISGNYSEYAESTNLQRAAKAYLMAGNKLGSGSGIKVF